MGSINYLKNKNKNERDKNANLDEATHIYNINGERDYTSMTTFIHSLFEKFDDDKIITNMMNSSKWEQNKYYGMSREEIKELWRKNNSQSTHAGTKMHYDIECFYNMINNNNNSVEFKYFMNFLESYNLIPIPINIPLENLNQGELFLGKGKQGLEICVFKSQKKQTYNFIQNIYKKRRKGRAAPVLIVLINNQNIIIF